MTYANYDQGKGGKSPKKAPHYVETAEQTDNKTKRDTKMNKYVCNTCGYVYNPENGDSDAGIKSGTRFADLPADWQCPMCGVSKDEFEKE